MIPEKSTLLNQEPILEFRKEEVCEKFSRIPQGILFWNLIGYPHDEWTGTSMQYLQNNLQSSINPSEADLERIFDRKNPLTDEEEEMMHLVNLRGAFDVLLSKYLERSTFPQQFITRFRDNAVSNATNEYEYRGTRAIILSELYEWAHDNLEKNIPIEIDEPVRESIESLYEKSQALVQFYKIKKMIITTEEYKNASYLEKARHWAYGNLLFILNPQAEIRALTWV